MIYRTPPLSGPDVEALAAIEALRDELRYFLGEPRRWYGTLRRTSLARAVQGSNSIEGYVASIEDVAAIVEGEEPREVSEDTRLAVLGYRDAMTYVLQLAQQPAQIDETLLKSLQFMMIKHDLSKNPGRWRPGAIWVEDQDGRVVYSAPDREQVEPLVAELVATLQDKDGTPLVGAAMAHLNLALIHPFSDGNGRMARCLQSLVLAGEGIISPEFASIEEYLGRHTGAYYAALNGITQGRWTPARSARPWVEFCLTAHFLQARTVLRRIRETEELWDRCEQLVARHHLPARCVGALCDAARGWRTRRSLYVKVTKSTIGEDLTDATATRDLRALAGAGLLEPMGQKRGRIYVPTADLRQLWDAIRARRPMRVEDSPYPADAQPRLPGIEA